jgi:hypothetical protein
MSPAQPHQQRDIVAVALPLKRLTPDISIETQVITRSSPRIRARASAQNLKSDEEVQLEIEIDNTASTPAVQPLRKRKAFRQEHSDDDEDYQKMSTWRLPASKRSKLPSRMQRQPSLSHMVLEDSKDSQMLTTLLQFSNTIPDRNRSL